MGIHTLSSIMIMIVRAKNCLEVENEEICIFFVIGYQLYPYLLFTVCVATKCSIFTLIYRMWIHYTEFIPVFFRVVGLLNFVMGKTAVLFRGARFLLLDVWAEIRAVTVLLRSSPFIL